MAMNIRIRKSDFHFSQFEYIYIVGVGGTGGWFVPPFLKSVAPHVRSTNSSIIIVDPDIVEPKNISRQNYIPSDVGKYKAEVMASRYGKAYGILDHVTVSPLTFHKEAVGKYVHNSNILIFGFVDNPGGRKSILEHLRKWTSFSGEAVYVDLGNEAHSGQAYVSILRDRNGQFGPILDDVFPELLNGTTKKNISCADEEQTIYVNTMAANVAFQISKELIFDHGIKNILTFFNIDRVTRQLDMKAVEEFVNLKSEVRSGDDTQSETAETPI